MKDYKHIEHMRNLNDSLIWERMKRCYDYGYEDGQKEKLANAMIHDHEVAEKKAYERGLNEAWEAARKIAQTYAHFTCYDLNRIFGDRDSVGRKMIFEEYTPQDAIRKIKEYEDKQKQDDWLDLINDQKDAFYSEGDKCLFESYVNELPSVTRQKYGKWIENASEYQNIDPPYICSECGNMHLRKTDYCDQCGCRMVEPQGRGNKE